MKSIVLPKDSALPNNKLPRPSLNIIVKNKTPTTYVAGVLQTNRRLLV